MKIKEMIEAAISDGDPIKIQTEGGKEGAYFEDREEFIAFEELGFSSEMGFFSLTDFSFLENEAE